MSPQRPEQLIDTVIHGARRALTVAALALLPGQAPAVELALPGPANLTASQREEAATFGLPTGPWDGAAIPARSLDGTVERRAWRVEVPGMPTLSLMAPLRDQIAADGYRILFECETEACGGFDFRYGSDLLPEPEMHVDLGDFRFLAAERGDEALALMVSRSAMAGFVQMTRVLPAGAPASVLTSVDPAPLRMAGSAAPLRPLDDGAATVTLSASGSPPDVILSLDTVGRVVLDDLVFQIGASDLAQGEYASLAAVAAWLRQDPARRIALVGHTDASGGLETNIVISQRRADSVRAKLVGTFGIPAAQVTSEGVGYLAPLASNATEEGRKVNRRVEAVVTMVP
jgi:outer membrane protein OmpA-like peptidoglycan-associated protein